MQDYFAPQASVPAASPPAAPPSAAVGTPSTRRRATARAVLPAVLLALLATVAVAAAAQRAQALPALTQAAGPAGAAAGWGPSWVDERGRPGRWDPCQPVRYVVNPAFAPPTGRADLADALRRISVASGLVFVDDGDTTETPSTERAAHQPERYGERWVPLLVAWSPPAATDVGLGGGTKGVALTVAVPGQAGPSILTGQVVLDAELRLPSGFGPGSTEGEVLLHELAHAVGLGHVDDPTQVMYFRTTNSDSEFGAGDRAGLAAVGAPAGCLPAPRPGPLRTG